MVLAASYCKQFHCCSLVILLTASWVTVRGELQNESVVKGQVFPLPLLSVKRRFFYFFYYYYFVSGQRMKLNSCVAS